MMFNNVINLLLTAIEYVLQVRFEKQRRSEKSSKQEKKVEMLDMSQDKVNQSMEKLVNTSSFLNDEVEEKR
jgi:hypothetical protein